MVRVVEGKVMDLVEDADGAGGAARVALATVAQLASSDHCCFRLQKRMPRAGDDK